MLLCFRPDSLHHPLGLIRTFRVTKIPVNADWMFCFGRRVAARTARSDWNPYRELHRADDHLPGWRGHIHLRQRVLRRQLQHVRPGAGKQDLVLQRVWDTGLHPPRGEELAAPEPPGTRTLGSGLQLALSCETLFYENFNRIRLIPSELCPENFRGWGLNWIFKSETFGFLQI